MKPLQRSLALLALVLLPAVLAAPARAGENRWTPFGPGEPFIHELALVPGAPSTLLAVAYEGGLYRSTDGGESWVWSGPGLPVTFGRAFAILAPDPDDPAILYAATDDGWIYRSENGGRGWALLPARPGVYGEMGVRSLAMAGGTIYAGGTRVYLSRDHGETWSLSFEQADVFDVAVAPSSPRTVFLGTSQGVWKSDDAGESWSRVLLDEGPGASLFYSALAISPSDPETVYAATEGPVYESRDGGATWERRGRLFFTSQLVADPVLPETVYAVDEEGVSVSRNGGGAWTMVLSGHLRDLQLDPARPGTLYAGTENLGLVVSHDGGTTWSTAAQRGLGAPRTLVLERDPDEPGTFYACCSSFFEPQCVRSVDDGFSWLPFRPSGRQPYVHDLAFDPRESEAVYAAGAGVYRIEDEGATWETLSLNPQTYGELLAVAVARGVLVVGGERGVFRSTNGGTAWKVVLPYVADKGKDPGSELDDLHRSVERLIQDPADPSILYALAVEHNLNLGIERAVVYQSLNGGARWRRALPGSALAIQQSRPKTVFVVQDGKLLRSRDRGAAWKLAGALPPRSVTSLAVHPTQASVLLAGTDGAGVLITRNGGRSWTPFNAGLARRGMTRVRSLSADPEVPGRFFVQMEEGGTFEVTVP